jgi:hypothetical protein
MLCPPLNKQRRGRSPGPIRPDEIHCVDSSRGSCDLNRISGDQDCGDDINFSTAVTVGAHDLKQRVAFVAADKDFAISTTRFEKHYQSSCSFHGTLWYFDILQIDSEGEFSGEDWIVGLNRFPHLLSVRISNGMKGREGYALKNEGIFSIYKSSCLPRISLEDYILKVWKEVHLEVSIIVVAFIYVWRLVHYKYVSLTCLTSHRLMITATFVAGKFMEDEVPSSRSFAMSGGVTVAELCRMERDFVSTLDWKLFVSKIEYDSVLNCLKNSDLI